jgi:hypothetical protein
MDKSLAHNVYEIGYCHPLNTQYFQIKLKDENDIISSLISSPRFLKCLEINKCEERSAWFTGSISTKCILCNIDSNSPIKNCKHYRFDGLSGEYFCKDLSKEELYKIVSYLLKSKNISCKKIHIYE